MSDVQVIKPLSEALSGGIERMYTLGGYGLVFTFTGTLCLVVANVLERSVISFVLAAVGALMVLAVLVLFYVKEIRPMQRAHGAVEANAELVDTVQATALEMTALADHLQALAFKYASEISSLITESRAWLQELSELGPVQALPPVKRLVSRVADNAHAERADDLSAAIVQVTEAAQTTIKDVERALATSDPSALRDYLVQIKALDSKVKGALAEPKEALSLAR